MNINETLQKYIESVKDAETRDIIYQNKLQLILGKHLKTSEYIINSILFKKNQEMLLSIIKLFKRENIPYITFKGSVLAHQLYEDPSVRIFSDIDIYVPQSEFEKALLTIQKEGYVLYSDDELSDEHHVRLKKDHYVIELHKNILAPSINIDESYFKNNVDSIYLKDTTIVTFNKTATLLHLIYHLYMDLCVYVSDYVLLTNKKWVKAPKMLLRLYEIALFSEKYKNHINWSDVINDIKSQKLRIHIKLILWDFVAVFPGLFPDMLIRCFNDIKCVYHPDDVLYKEFMNLYYNHNLSFDEALSNLVDSNWKNDNKTVVKHDTTITFCKDKIYTSLSGISKKAFCLCEVKFIDKGLVFNFDVTTDDLFISDIDCLDVQATSGIHIFLCTTKGYSYKSIFLFPKETESGIIIVPYDVKNCIPIKDEKITAFFKKTDKGYRIEAFLSETFFPKQTLKPHFYMQLVVPLCNGETGKLEANLVTCSNESRWYHPLDFIKIEYDASQF